LALAILERYAPDASHRRSENSPTSAVERRKDQEPFVMPMRGRVSLPFMVMPPTIEVANIGMADSLILMVMALVVFGPRRLPQIGRQIGKLMYEFRKASNDFKFQMEEELRSSEEADRRKKEEERLRAAAAAAPPPASGTTEASLEAGTSTPASETSSETQALVPDGQFPTPSPYPGEEVYPPVIEPAATEPTVTESSATTPAVAQVQPVLQPPSTGEQVPAARPWNLEDELGKLSTSEATSETSSVSGENPADKPADESTPATEQAAHNG
jgi:sec-independent protein translocase protein TatB